MKTVVMKLYAIGEIPVNHASHVLSFMSTAYSGLKALNDIQSALFTGRYSHELLIKEHIYFDHSNCIWRPKDFNIFGDALPQHSLELKAVVLQSPGFWEFLGALNPLESIRSYITDRHERLKDTEYRNHIEMERGEIENRILKLKLVNEFVATAKYAGLADDEISNLVRDNALIPLLRLESLQDINVVTYADIPQNNMHDELDELDA